MLAQSLQSCPTLCDPMNCSPPGSSVHGILQARMLQWEAMPVSRGSSWPRDRTCVFCVSCIAAGFFYPWATREAQREHKQYKCKKKLQVVSKFRIHPHQRVLLRNCKSKPHTRRKCFQSIYDKIVVSGIYGELPQINKKGQLSFCNGQKDLNRHFTDGALQVANQHTKFSIPLFWKEIKLQPYKVYYIFIEWIKFKTLMKPSVGKNVGQPAAASFDDDCVNRYNHFAESLIVSYKVKPYTCPVSQ